MESLIDILREIFVGWDVWAGPLFIFVVIMIWGLCYEFIWKSRTIARWRTRIAFKKEN